MCGIVAEVIKNNAFYFPGEGLKRLEYRGCDSFGMDGIESSEITIRKTKGKVVLPENQISTFQVTTIADIGHTKSSAYGKPADIYAWKSIHERVQSILDNADQMKYIAIEIKNKNHTNAI
jgi:glucosamine 6-phosphate synthetase-like amidotransferase/phosphosugar isomerase protein